MLMTKIEAIKFLQDVLNLPLSNNDDIATLKVLNDIIKRFQHVIPFQSVTACAVPNSERHLPSHLEIKQQLFSIQGGLCYHIHIFMKELLQALGFKVIFVSVDIARRDDHITVIALNLSGEGSRHLVEVGCGYPTFHAISLDFEKESKVIISGFLRHKFVKQNGNIIWYHEPRYAYRPFKPSELSFDGWYTYAVIKADIPRDISFFESSMTAVYTVEEDNKFLQEPRAVTFKNGKLVAIKGNHLIVEKSDRKVEKEEIKSLDEVLQLYEKYFPQIPKEIIQDSIKFSPFNIC